MVLSRKELIEKCLEFITINRAQIRKDEQVPLLGARYEREVVRVESEYDKLMNDFRKRLSELSMGELTKVEIGELDPSTHLESGSTCLMRAYTDEGCFIGSKKSVPVQDCDDDKPPIHKTFFTQFEEFINRNSGYVLAGLGLNDSFADFEYRSKLTEISIAECAWLALGLKPSGELVDDDDRPVWKNTATDMHYIEQVDSTLELFERNFGKTGAINAKSAPAFLAWLEASGFQSHHRFVPMILKIAANGVAITQVMQPIGSQQLISKPDQKESDYMARILTAMAMDKYGYDPEKVRSDVPKQIADVANKQGFSITTETVRKYLKRGARLLQSDIDRPF